MAINTYQDLLLSKNRQKPKTKTPKKTNKKSGNDLQSFCGNEIYSTNPKTKISASKLKDSFLSNVSFAGSVNATAYYTGGSYGQYGGGNATGANGAEKSDGVNKNAAPEGVTKTIVLDGVNKSNGINRAEASRGTNRAETVNDDFNVDANFEHMTVKEIKLQRKDLIAKYKTLQIKMNNLDKQREETAESLAEIRSMVRDINEYLLSA